MILFFIESHSASLEKWNTQLKEMVINISKNPMATTLIVLGVLLVAGILISRYSSR